MTRSNSPSAGSGRLFSSVAEELDSSDYLKSRVAYLSGWVYNCANRSITHYPTHCKNWPNLEGLGQLCQHSPALNF
jgi:hypothetical protein